MPHAAASQQGRAAVGNVHIPTLDEICARQGSKPEFVLLSNGSKAWFCPGNKEQGLASVSGIDADGRWFYSEPRSRGTLTSVGRPTPPVPLGTPRGQVRTEEEARERCTTGGQKQRIEKSCNIQCHTNDNRKIGGKTCYERCVDNKTAACVGNLKPK